MVLNSNAGCAGSSDATMSRTGFSSDFGESDVRSNTTRPVCGCCVIGRYACGNTVVSSKPYTFKCGTTPTMVRYSRSPFSPVDIRMRLPTAS